MIPLDRFEPDLRRAADAIASAEALVFAAGAGMGVDSGLPDFRGNEGFWKAYPPYAHLGLRFAELANPRWFREKPTLAWGFYGHRLNLYRATVPHGGFALLKRWGERAPLGYGVVTSNIDGHFQRAGFDPRRVVEIHGTIDWLQCLAGCGVGIFSAEPVAPIIDEATMHAARPLPTCPRCGALARPNVLMFGDFDWDDARTHRRQLAFARWIQQISERDRSPRIAIIECGAGTAIPSIRHTSESLVDQYGGTLIRINPREPEVPRGQIGLPLGARVALEAIDERLPR